MGGYIDNSPTLFSTSDGGILSLQRVERFAHNVSDYHMFGIGFGAEVPLNYVTPFLEWNLGIPIGPDDLNDCDVAVPGCPRDVGFSAFPNVLTLGLRGTPVAGMSLSFGADIGLTGEESTGLPAVPPYNIVFGMAYNFEPSGSEEAEIVPVEPQIVYVETPVEAAPAPTSWILGEVVSGEEGETALVDGAIVSYPGTELNDQVTNTETGRFRSYEFATGTEVEVLITHPDFEERSFVRVLEDEGQWGVRIRLQPDLNLETLSGMVSTESGEAIMGTAYVRGGEEAHEVALNAETQGFSFDLVAGSYVVVVVSEGFVTERETVVLEEDAAVEISMTQSSPEQAAFLYVDRIYLSGEKIRFEGDELSLMSEELLDQVAAIMDRNSDLRIQVAAYGDDSSTEESTLERAEAVVEYLTSFGIDVERIEAVGRGGVDPLVPNISARNRDRNNRVELFVIE
jgi:outer membrane protein OmpA-like peptidoglycan-associated protein